MVGSIPTVIVGLSLTVLLLSSTVCQLLKPTLPIIYYACGFHESEKASLNYKTSQLRHTFELRTIVKCVNFLCPAFNFIVQVGGESTHASKKQAVGESKGFYSVCVVLVHKLTNSEHTTAL